LAVTLVLENRLDLLVVMPTVHGKSAVFMIPPMVTAHTVIVMVPLTILVSERDLSRLTTRDLSHGHDHV
jgi:superfamily II DNA helicase RecQ